MNSKDPQKDLEKVIKRLDKNKIEVKVYSYDKRLKRKSHFQIKYDLLTNNTNVTTNTTKTTNTCLTSQQIHRKDSFIRFGDDLSELILDYLPLKHKFRYESVCKQWQQLVYNKQTKLNLTNLTHTRLALDQIDGLIGLDIKALNIIVNCERLRLVLRKCSKINEIYINFKKHMIRPGLSFSIDGTVLQIITDSCNWLKKFNVCAVIENVTEDQIKAFANKFGKSLIELRFKYSSDSIIKQFLVSNDFPKLQKLDFNTIVCKSKEDLVKQFAKCHSFRRLSQLKYTFSGFDGINVITGPDFSHLQTLDIVLDVEMCPPLAGSGVNTALKQISNLKTLEVFNIKIFTEEMTITAIDEGLQRIADNCPLIKRLDFIMDRFVLKRKLFDVFSLFRALEYCELSIEYNRDIEDYGSIKEFQNCSSLQVFNLYLYNICDKHLVDIDVYIPKMTNFHLRSNRGITDSTLKYLKNCKQLEVLEIHTYDDYLTLINITDSTLSQLITSCPKLRIVFLFCRQRSICFDKSFSQMIEKARLQPKVKHLFGFRQVVSLCKKFAEKHKKLEQSSLCLPLNLRLIELPQWTAIQIFDYYCNYKKTD